MLRHECYPLLTTKARRIRGFGIILVRKRTLQCSYFVIFVPHLKIRGWVDRELKESCHNRESWYPEAEVAE